jgi:hypothetical protein
MASAHALSAGVFVGARMVCVVVRVESGRRNEDKKGGRMMMSSQALKPTDFA